MIKLPQISMGCDFKAQVIRNDGSIKYEGPWFSNTILNSGLDMLTTEHQPVRRFFIRTALTRCNVGEGSTTPSTSDEGLVEFVASTDRIYGGRNTASDTSTGPLPWMEWFHTYEFAVGTFSTNVNLREIGLSYDSNEAYINRQLFKDEDGNTVTISVQSDEGLRVSVSFKAYGFAPVDTSVLQSMEINGEEKDVEVVQLPDMFSQSSWGIPRLGEPKFLRAVKEDDTEVEPSSMPEEEYQVGSYSRVAHATWNAGAFSDDVVKEFEVHMMHHWGSSGTNARPWCRIILPEPIGPISDTQELTASFKRSWGRYEP